MISKCSHILLQLASEEPKPPVHISLLNDYFCGGLHEGLYIIGADAGMGKSLLCSQLGAEAVFSGHKVLYVSAEMSGRIVADRLFNMYRNICEDFDNYYIWDDKSITSDMILNAVDEIKPDLVIVDYIQFIGQPSNKPGNMDMKDVVKCTLNALLQIINKYRIPVIAISSLVKSSSSIQRGISMHDFKDSSCIEYDADFLLGLQYSGVNEGKTIIKSNVDNEDYKRVEIVTLKDRHCKLKQSDQLILDKKNCIFIEADKETKEEVVEEDIVWE